MMHSTFPGLRPGLFSAVPSGPDGKWKKKSRALGGTRLMLRLLDESGWAGAKAHHLQ
jgi:hypothetical protein